MRSKLDIKEMTTISVLVSFLIVQNYVLYSIPFTLTYAILYVMARRVKSLPLSYLAIIVFVTVKNIIYMALPTTIILDLVGLFMVVTVSRIKFKWLRYPIIPIIIFIHILMLDLSFALLSNEIFKTLLASMASGFITYIYAPLSIVLIVMIDGFEFLTTDTSNLIK